MSSPIAAFESMPDAFGAPIRHGAWEIRPAVAAERAALSALRGLAFRGGGADGDAFDARCLHLWLEDRVALPGEPLATVRMQLHPEGDLAQGYAAQFFGLEALAQAPGIHAVVLSSPGGLVDEALLAYIAEKKAAAPDAFA